MPCSAMPLYLSLCRSLFVPVFHVMCAYICLCACMHVWRYACMYQPASGPVREWVSNAGAFMHVCLYVCTMYACTNTCVYACV